MGTWQERLARAIAPFQEAHDREKENRLFSLTWGEQAALKAGEEAHEEAEEIQSLIDDQTAKYEGRITELEEEIAELQKRCEEETERADAWREAVHSITPLIGTGGGEVFRREAKEALKKARRLQARHDASAHGVARRPDG